LGGESGDAFPAGLGDLGAECGGVGADLLGREVGSGFASAVEAVAAWVAVVGAQVELGDAGWSMDALKNAKVGRSHRAVDVRARMQEVVDLTRKVLEVPADYHIAITPGSDTGAMEMAIWSLLGPRGVDVLVFDHFGHLWIRR
jgi:phosphoserine aminotransferase